MSQEDIIRSAISSQTDILITSCQFGGEPVLYNLFQEWDTTYNKIGHPRGSGPFVRASEIVSYGVNKKGLQERLIVACRGGDYEAGTRTLTIRVGFMAEYDHGLSNVINIVGLGAFTLNKTRSDQNHYSATITFSGVPQTTKMVGPNVQPLEDRYPSFVFSYETVTHPPIWLGPPAPTPPTFYSVPDYPYNY